MALNFMPTWNYNIRDRKILPFLDSLIGTELRFRDNEIDRRKLYLYHSPAHTVSQILSKKSGVFWKTPLYCSALDEDEWKREGFDRFLTFKIEYGFRGDDERLVCTYVTLKIEPCEVEPLRKGGVTEGSRITGYDIVTPKNNTSAITIDEDTTIHDLMNVDVNYYYKWLYRQIIIEYESEVHSAVNDDEEKAEETVSSLKRLCNDLEENIAMAKRLLCLII